MLIERLNELYQNDPSPDAIARALVHPLATFVRCKDITEEFWNSLPDDLEICFYSIDGKCWDGMSDVETVMPQSKSDWTWNGCNPINERFMSNWAIIAYEHRMLANPSCLSLND